MKGWNINMNSLTNKQKETLLIIQEFISKNGYSPSIREIGKELNVNSPATVYTHLKKLRGKGYIIWEEKQDRTIRIIREVS